jgi:hypothetical protein
MSGFMIRLSLHPVVLFGWPPLLRSGDVRFTQEKA